MTDFTIGNLDLSGITDADLVNKSDKVRFLKKPGRYNFTITETKFSKEESIRRDAAGNRWIGLMVAASTEVEGNTYLVKDFVDVPLDSGTYISQAGKPSLGKLKILQSFLSSVAGRALGVNELPAAMANLTNLAGKTLGANVKYKADHIRRVAENEYNIVKIDGKAAINEDGDVATFASYETAVEAYKALNGGRAPKGLQFSSFVVESN